MEIRTAHEARRRRRGRDHESTKGRKHEKDRDSRSGSVRARAPSSFPFRVFVLSCFRDEGPSRGGRDPGSSPRPGRIARRGGGPADRPVRRPGPPAPRTVRRPAGSPGRRPGPGHSNRRSASTRSVRLARSDRRRPVRRVRFARSDRRRSRGRVRFAGFHRHEPAGRARLASSPRRLHHGPRPGRVPPRMEPERRIHAPIHSHGVGCPRGGMTVRFAERGGSPARRRLGPARRSRPEAARPPRRPRWDLGLAILDCGLVKRNPKSPIQDRKSGSAGPRRRPGPLERPPHRPGIRPSPTAPARPQGRPRAPDRQRRRRPRAGASPGC